MSNHTPGPWYVGGDMVWSFDDDGEIAVVIRVHERDQEFEANSRLIAAAPDLLEALEDLLGWQSTAPDSVKNAARQTIAKAKGKTE